MDQYGRVQPDDMFSLARGIQSLGDAERKRLGFETEQKVNAARLQESALAIEKANKEKNQTEGADKLGRALIMYSDGSEEQNRAVIENFSNSPANKNYTDQTTLNAGIEVANQFRTLGETSNDRLIKDKAAEINSWYMESSPNGNMNVNDFMKKIKKEGKFDMSTASDNDLKAMSKARGLIMEQNKQNAETTMLLEKTTSIRIQNETQQLQQQSQKWVAGLMSGDPSAVNKIGTEVADRIGYIFSPIGEPHWDNQQQALIVDTPDGQQLVYDREKLLYEIELLNTDPQQAASTLRQVYQSIDMQNMATMMNPSVVKNLDDGSVLYAGMITDKNAPWKGPQMAFWDEDMNPVERPDPQYFLHSKLNTPMTDQQKTALMQTANKMLADSGISPDDEDYEVKFQQIYNMLASQREDTEKQRIKSIENAPQRELDWIESRYNIYEEAIKTEFKKPVEERNMEQLKKEIMDEVNDMEPTRKNGILHLFNMYHTWNFYNDEPISSAEIPGAKKIRIIPRKEQVSAKPETAIERTKQTLETIPGAGLVGSAYKQTFKNMTAVPRGVISGAKGLKDIVEKQETIKRSKENLKRNLENLTK